MNDIDIAKVKRNVSTMVQKNAPESDIDKYISDEGTTIDAVKNFKPDNQIPKELDITDPDIGGIARGAGGRMLGIYNLLNNIGVGKHLGIPDNDVIGEAQKIAEEKGRGTGVKGFIEEQAGDPLNYVPVGKIYQGGKWLVKAGEESLKRGALSGLLGGGAKDIKENIENSAIGGAEGSVAGPVAGITGKGVGRVVGSGLSYQAAKLAEKIGIKPKASELYRAAKEAGLQISGKTAKEVHQELDNWFKNQTVDIGKSISAKDLKPLATNHAISKMYGVRKEESRKLYSNLEQVGSGKKVEAGELLENIQGLINHLKSQDSLSPSKSAALDDLQRIQGKIMAQEGRVNPYSDGYLSGYAAKKPPAVELNDLVALKQVINSGFNPKKLISSKTNPDARLFSYVNDELQKYAKSDPIFSQALSAADNHYMNKVAPFKDSKVLGKFWKPEDYVAFRNMNRLEQMPADLQQRAYKILDSIKTPVDMNVIFNSMEPAEARQVAAGKFSQIMKDSGLSGDKIAKRYDVLQKILEHDPKALAQLDSVKKVVDMLNDRGIGGNITPVQLAEKNTLLKRGFSAMWSLFSHGPAQSLKHAAGAVEEPSTEIQSRLKDIPKEIKSGSPRKILSREMNNVISQAVGNPVGNVASRVAATDIGKQPLQNNQ